MSPSRPISCDSPSRSVRALLVGVVATLLGAACGGSGGAAPETPASPPPPAPQLPPSPPAPSLNGPYRISDLSASWTSAGPPAGTACSGRPVGPFATDLNDFGEIAAYYVSGQASEQCAVIWTGSAWADPGPASSLFWYPAALSNSRRVSGYALDPGTRLSTAAVWSSGAFTRVSPALSSAVDVNDGGQAVVQILEPANASFFWDGTALRPIGTLGGSLSSGRAISGLGIVVGSSTTALDQTHAFLWDGVRIEDLGTLGGDSSVALDVNDTRQVVGSSREQGVATAFIWEAGSMRSLGLPAGTSRLPSSEARSINELGQVVGIYGVPARNDEKLSQTGGRAVLWVQGTGYDLLAAL